MRCASCGGENPEDAKFCEECGTPFVRRCPSCGQQARPTAKFCPECGTTLKTDVKPPPAKSRKRKGAPLARKATRPTSAEAERRQLTVMFCDPVGSTPLSQQLDPEELRTVILAYRETCASAIARFGGYLAKYIGDGLLVYFGYPQAHEDDAQRAVRAGLEIVAAIRGQGARGGGQGNPHALNAPLSQPLQVRIGIHTGLVVAGEMGVGDQPEPLAIVGETPNIAARLQEHAPPNSVVISPATYRLVTGLFECQDLGPQLLKGISTPLSVYRVVGASAAQSRFEVAVSAGLTPLVGREHEVGLLRRRWEQAKEGDGQVVLLSGEPGIGKSRLVQTLKEHVSAEGATRIEFRCSPYHQNSAFYPIIAHLQRLLQFAQDEAPQTKLSKLQQLLAQYRFPQAETLPLLAALLSLPQPKGAPAITLSPQKQKQKTQEALVSWLVEEAERHPVYSAWEDLHWADPSSLELLGLLIDQVPTTRLFVVLTCRPEFSPPWLSRAYLSALTLNRLPRTQAEEMMTKVTGGKALPAEVVHQVVSKTDGVPLFVEELTKMVLESNLVREVEGQYELNGPLPPLAIPSTLQDSLMARLDRLATVREIAQIGATLGREFDYALLHAVSPLNEDTLQQGLRQLVEAELVYQNGLPPRARYLFKHALVQDTAYQSLLKSKRQQYHQQIAQVLERRFPETKEAQPELLARHYTEAGLVGQAIPYWHQAGQRAIERSANVEAISHLTKGLELLKTLPDTPNLARQELALHIALGSPLIATKGWAAPETERAYTRARELCEQIGETTQLFPILWGLWQLYDSLGESRRADELGEQLFTLAQRQQDPALLRVAHYALAWNLYHVGEFVSAREHSEQGLSLYDLQQHRSLAFVYGQDLGVSCLFIAALALWHLGYPDRALKKSYEALTLAQELAQPFSLAIALALVVAVHHFRQEVQSAQEQANALIVLCTEQELSFFLAWGTIWRGWTLTAQGQGDEGIAQMHQGLAAERATGTETWWPHFLALLAEAYEEAGQVEEGLNKLAEALDFAREKGERYFEAELHRLRGELTLQQFKVQDSKFKVTRPRSPTLDPQEEAEACFLKAIEISRKQQAKSLELRATTSLAWLWQQQGKKEEARQMLAEIYGWFIEGFDTKNLQEARALLEELA